MTLTQRELDELSMMALSELHVALGAFQDEFLQDRKSLVERAFPGAMKKPGQQPRAVPKEVNNAPGQ